MQGQSLATAEEERKSPTACWGFRGDVGASWASRASRSTRPTRPYVPLAPLWRAAGQIRLLAVPQDREAVNLLDASVSGARAEFFLYLFDEAPPADRHRLAPLFLPLEMAGCQARIDPLVSHRRQALASHPDGARDRGLRALVVTTTVSPEHAEDWSTA